MKGDQIESEKGDQSDQSFRLVILFMLGLAIYVWSVLTVVRGRR